MEQSNSKTLAKDKAEFVSCLMTNKEGNVIIFKRRDDLKFDAGKYDFCSGHIKEGETPTQTMYREIREEIGINPEQIALTKMGIIGTPHKDLEDKLCYVYLGKLNIDIAKLNEMIKSVEEPELQEAISIENINGLRKILEEGSSQYRMTYTKQMGFFLDAVEQIMNKQEENDNIR